MVASKFDITYSWGCVNDMVDVIKEVIAEHAAAINDVLPGTRPKTYNFGEESLVKNALIKRGLDSIAYVCIFSIQDVRVNETRLLRYYPRFECIFNNRIVISLGFQGIPDCYFEDARLQYDDVSLLLPKALKRWTHIKTLHIMGCSELEELPKGIGRLVNLRELHLNTLPYLKQLDDALWSLGNLQSLKIGGCSKLQTMPAEISRLTNLVDLQMQGIASVPSSIGLLTKLKSLRVNRSYNLKTLPSTIGDLVSLQDLVLDRCHALERLPDSIGNLACLECLDLRFCSSLVNLPSAIMQLWNLNDFDISFCPAQATPVAVALANRVYTNLWLEGKNATKKYIRDCQAGWDELSYVDSFFDFISFYEEEMQLGAMYMPTRGCCGDNDDTAAKVMDSISPVRIRTQLRYRKPTPTNKKNKRISKKTHKKRNKDCDVAMDFYVVSC